MNRARAAVACAMLLGCTSAPANPASSPASSWSGLPAEPVPAETPLLPARVELGRMLFYDPVLSRDRAVACATCHGEIWGFSDGLARSIGVGGIGPAGTGRHGGTPTRRNAPTLWNAAWREHLFWDGRAASLEAQMLGPMNDATELGRPPDEVVAALRTIAAYGVLFRAAFPGDPDPVTVPNLQRAIATFERTLVSDHAPWDRLQHGDALALGDAERRGMALFTALRCDACHVPPRFETERYAPSPVPVSPDDPGRFAVTMDPADRGMFRVPTLRNVGETAPYFHDGSVASLAAAVALEASARPGARVLSDTERDDLVAFVASALADHAHEPERPDAVPSGLMVPLDGYRIPR